jgi:glutamate 5-kinase
MSTPQRREVATARRVVVKIGSAVLTGDDGRFDPQRHAALCADLSEAARGRDLVVVTSGAIAMGVQRLKLPARPSELPLKQAAAAVGQSRLMHRYETELDAHGHVVAQILLTHADLADRQRYLNARQTLSALLAARVIPIVNENDTVSVEEIRFGDNDTLASLVVGLCDADLLVLLSDVEGLYSRDPRLPGPTPPTLVPEVAEVTPALLATATASRSGVGTGGMATKLMSARRAAEVGARTVIASGRSAGTLPAVLAGDPVGTLFDAPDEARLTGRKRWIGHALHPLGSLRVDAGAATAIRDRGKSLLPSGLVDVEGDFDRGSPVDIRDTSGKAFARGLSGYASADLRRLRGLRSSEIERTLGYKFLDEIVHRDDLVLLEGTRQ